MSIQKLSDNELIKLYVGGNEDSLAVLLERYQKRIFSSIIVVIRDQQLAEDIFQDTFFKVILTLKKGQYDEQGKFLPWVVRIARNLIIDHYRRARKMPPVPVYVNDEGEEISVFSSLPAPDDANLNAETKILRKDMRQFIAQLPVDQREVVLMRIYYDMSFKEIAEFTNVSINTALGRMRYALMNLRKMINEKRPELASL